MSTQEYRLQFVFTNDAGQEETQDITRQYDYDHVTKIATTRELAIPVAELTRVQAVDKLAVVYESLPPKAMRRTYAVPPSTEWPPVQALPHSLRDVLLGELVPPTEEHGIIYTGINDDFRGRRLRIKVPTLERVTEMTRRGRTEGIEVVLIEQTRDVSRYPSPVIATTERRGYLRAVRVPAQP